MARKKTLDGILTEFQARHGDKYDYSLIKSYEGNHAKAPIKCRKCGDVFMQEVVWHKSGHGCPRCGGSLRYTTENWIKRVKEIHGDVYDYSFVKYKNQKGKVKILCRRCNKLFKQSAGNHLSGQGCPHCKKERLRTLYQNNTQDFIEKAVAVHGDRYDYSLVDYKGAHKKVEIICKKCGKSFKQKPCNHTNTGAGCPHCRAYGFKDYKEGFLYILLDNLREPSFMKIGVAHKISRRLTELRGATPFDVCLAMYLRMAGDACLEVELSLHKMFKDLNLNLKGFNGATEWFDFSEDVFDSALDLAEDRYTFLKRRY